MPLECSRSCITFSLGYGRFKVALIAELVSRIPIVLGRNTQPARKTFAGNGDLAPVSPGAHFPPRNALLLLAVIVCAVGSASWIVRRHTTLNRQHVEREALATLGAVAELKLAQVTRWLTERRADAALLADEPRLVAKGLAVLSAPDDADALAALDRWLQYVLAHSTYSSALLVDPELRTVSLFTRTAGVRTKRWITAGSRCSSQPVSSLGR